MSAIRKKQLQAAAFIRPLLQDADVADVNAMIAQQCGDVSQDPWFVADLHRQQAVGRQGAAATDRELVPVTGCAEEELFQLGGLFLVNGRVEGF